MNLKFKLLDIKLTRSSFALNKRVIAEAKSEKKFAIRKKMGIAIGKNDEDKSLIKVALRVSNEDPDSPFNFDLLYEGYFKFELSEEVAEEEIEKVCFVNCAAIIFPYLREHLADLTRRSGLPPFHLPPVNFVRLYKEKRYKTHNNQDDQ